jgi:hypothetical protein
MCESFYKNVILKCYKLIKMEKKIEQNKETYHSAFFEKSGSKIDIDNNKIKYNNTFLSEELKLELDIITNNKNKKKCDLNNKINKIKIEKK